MIPIHTDLKGKVAVITGGSGILGSGFAKSLAECGVKVAIIGRNQDKLNKVVQEITGQGGIAIPVVADVLQVEQLKKANDLVKNTLGTCDILINAAGGNHSSATTSTEHLNGDADSCFRDEKTLFNLDKSGIEYVLNLNYLGTLLPTQIFASDMVGKKGCSIINISSMNAYTPLTKIPAYSAAKAAINNFTQWLCVYLSKVGIRVNAIAPGFFLTEQNYDLLVTEDGSLSERAQKIIEHTPMGRFGEQSELVGTLLWLVDERLSGFVNGVVIPVDGGFSAYSGV
ncbi:D-mannonate oxidoreductase [Pradoshia eiseniae]|uniref:D-mannonate oxidoreductase n=1 Tax=Pradoshia eiseniae TaxID=2064768 RepID=A0A2S7N1M5_9BACI|nr:SDR family oxidoreductase [Pradoshia eiseniae]PQD95926.1 D-mannonate oxidoreductase [Pradoshia eiseniae]